MIQASLKINGKTYIGIGMTHTEARENAQQLVVEKINGGIACISRKYQRVEQASR